MTVDELRTIALALPETAEVTTWGEYTWRVRNKIFVMAAEESGAGAVKSDLATQAELVASDPETFSVASHTGRFGWVRVELGRVSAEELRELVVDAWRRTAPKRLVASSGL